MVDGPPVGSPLFDPAKDFVPDTAALRALAHPLRLRLLGLLRGFGPSTASRLAERVGESSGLTSYHLRQLEQAGLVVDADPEDLTHVERTGGRERWWRAGHRGTFTEPSPPGDEEADALAADYLRTVFAANVAGVQRWLSAEHRWPRPWREAWSFDDIALHLTVEETARLQRDLQTVLARYRRFDPAVPAGTADVPADAVSVVVQSQVYPSADQDVPAPAVPERSR